MSKHIVAIDLQTSKACGAFNTNTTFFLRVGVRDIKQFKYVFHSQV